MTNVFTRQQQQQLIEPASTRVKLRDVSNNFPLGSSRWVNPQTRKPATSTVSSARNLLCGFSNSRVTSTTTIKNNGSYGPSKEVAAAWVQMGSTSPVEALPNRALQQQQQQPQQRQPSRSNSSSAARDARESYRTTRSSAHVTTHSRYELTNTATTGRGGTYCGSRRVPESLTSQRNSRGRSPQAYQSHSTAQRWKERLSAAPKVGNSKKDAHWPLIKNMSEWKSAVDPKSGRTYYYNVKTRETQWRKPMELASPAEQEAMASKERKQKEFFTAMEANILKSMAQGQMPRSPNDSRVSLCESSSSLAEPKQPRKSLMQKPLPLVRTISSMDDTLLRDLVIRQPSHRTIKMQAVEEQESFTMQSLEAADAKRKSVLEALIESSREFNGSPYMDASKAMDMSMMDFSAANLNFELDDSSTSFGLDSDEAKAIQDLAKTANEMTRVSNDLSVADGLFFEAEIKADEGEGIEVEVVESPKPEVTKFEDSPAGESKHVLDKPTLNKRNSCGTIYVGTTMSAPDKDATIKCVCGVYRAHIISADKEDRLSYSDEYRIFNDRDDDREIGIERLSLRDAKPAIPTLDEIASFYRDVFRRAQMESDCIIMSLIYVERLIKSTEGALRPRARNWRSLLFSCIILSSKVWDDLSMWNADFSQTCPAGVKYPLQRINELEVAILTALKYKVKVPASEYAKYYFVLRSMLIKSGLGGDDLKTMTPLDVEGAKKLEQVSTNFQAMAATKRRVSQANSLRSKSMGEAEKATMLQGVQRARQDVKASLEHMVKM